MARSLLFITSLLAISVTLCYAQERLYAWESEVAFNYKIDQWRLNSSLAHRTVGIEAEEIISNRLAFVEVNQFISRRISRVINLSFGYKYRKINPTREINSLEHRTTQQLAYTHSNDRIRLVSRLRGEQRFIPSNFAHRYRYRFSADFPLSGFKLDVNEFFAVLSNELLLEIEKESESIDNRISIGVGYTFSKKLNGQVVYTLRSEQLNQTVDHISFLTTSLVFSL